MVRDRTSSSARYIRAKGGAYLVRITIYTRDTSWEASRKRANVEAEVNTEVGGCTALRGRGVVGEDHCRMV